MRKISSKFTPLCLPVNNRWYPEIWQKDKVGDNILSLSLPAFGSSSVNRVNQSCRSGWSTDLSNVCRWQNTNRRRLRRLIVTSSRPTNPLDPTECSLLQNNNCFLSLTPLASRERSSITFVFFESIWLSRLYKFTIHLCFLCLPVLACFVGFSEILSLVTTEGNHPQKINGKERKTMLLHLLCSWTLS